MARYWLAQHRFILVTDVSMCCSYQNATFPLINSTHS
jgi:hypothetical protein